MLSTDFKIFSNFFFQEISVKSNIQLLQMYQINKVQLLIGPNSKWNQNWYSFSTGCPGKDSLPVILKLCL